MTLPFSLLVWIFVEDFHPLRQLSDMSLHLIPEWINLIGLGIKHLTILEVSGAETQVTGISNGI